VGDDLGVAGVRRLAAEDGGGKAVATQLLVHQAQLQLAIALAAEFGAEVTGPKALGLHLVLQGLDKLLAAQGAMGGHAQVAEGFDLLAHEVLDPVELLLEFRIGLEVPGHHRPPVRQRAAYCLFNYRADGPNAQRRPLRKGARRRKVCADCKGKETP